eukprot:3123832-Alexandrium_andersonii.AAC.1
MPGRPMPELHRSTGRGKVSRPNMITEREASAGQQRALLCLLSGRVGAQTSLRSEHGCRPIHKPSHACSSWCQRRTLTKRVTASNSAQPTGQ